MSEKIKKLIKAIAGAVFIAAVCAGIWYGLRVLLTDDTGSYTRVTLHEFYSQDNIDVLFLGASHCYRGIAPEITDEKLGLNTFNMGSSYQRIDTTYLLMKEAVELYDIDHIYVELSYNVAKKHAEFESDLTDTYIVTDYMKPSLRKAAYLLERSGDGDYANSFLVARRNWKKIFEPGYIKELAEKKQSDAYKNYEYPDNDEERYAGKGYVESDVEIPEGSFKNRPDEQTIKLEEIDPEWDKTVLDMIKFCEKHKVALTFFSTPLTSFRLLCYDNYDDFIDKVNGLIKESGSSTVEYLDFSLMKEEYWPDTSTLFKDNRHLNAKGAELFSSIFADYINGRLTYDELFHKDIREKFASMEPGFYGTEYRENADDTYYDCRLVINREEETKSFVTFISDEGEEIILKEFSSGTEFRIPMDLHGACVIGVGTSENDVQTYTTYY
ncbi:MAG: hypothetical protein K6B44_09910 [Lachnospiraceae bacterium]|nr:hypothetical protein [Lachnospiraceae bacterium]